MANTITEMQHILTSSTQVYQKVVRWLKQRWSKGGRWSKLFFVGVALGAIAFVLMVLLAWGYRFSQRDIPVSYGVSFSLKYAEELGVDWKANFTALLDDLQIRHYRLMSYWEYHEPENGRYDFKALDWQMDEATKRGAKVMLAVGLRQPRWPECHIPTWAADLPANDWQRELDEYIAAVAQRYSKHPALDTYQLENEYYNRNFGTCDHYGYSVERLRREKEIIHSVDPRHPVVISFANQLGMPFRGPHPDIYATSLYRGNYIKHLGYVAYPIPSHFYAAKSQLVRWLHGREVLIHELQLEPWGPRATKDLSNEEQLHYMPTSRMADTFVFARRTGMKEIHLWGAEWWYWRKEQRGDPAMWETVREGLEQTGPVSRLVN